MEENKTFDMYIGAKKVKQAVNLDDVTKIEFEDGTKDEMPFKMYQGIGIITPTDDSSLWHLRCQTVVKEILEVMLRFGVKLSEVEHISQLITTSIQESQGAAITKLFGNEFKDRKLSDIDKVLRSVDKGVDK